MMVVKAPLACRNSSAFSVARAPSSCFLPTFSGSFQLIFSTRLMSSLACWLTPDLAQPCPYRKCPKLDSVDIWVLLSENSRAEKDFSVRLGWAGLAKCSESFEFISCKIDSLSSVAVSRPNPWKICCRRLGSIFQSAGFRKSFHRQQWKDWDCMSEAA